VLVHALALVEVQDRVVLQLPLVLHARRSSIVLAVLMIVTVLLLTVLHAVEASAWAGAYVALGARADFASAMLYSLSAMTTYGHADVFLATHWQLMGAIEALNGMMLFGLSTAFLFAVLREHWPTRLRPQVTPTNDFNGLGALLRTFSSFSGALRGSERGGHSECPGRPTHCRFVAPEKQKPIKIVSPSEMNHFASRVSSR
jgi:hypothetical protein